MKKFEWVELTREKTEVGELATEALLEDGSVCLAMRIRTVSAMGIAEGMVSHFSACEPYSADWHVVHDLKAGEPK
jgi:hypothetical protein